MTPPACPYCGRQAELVTGYTIYPHRPDLADHQAWQCAPCDAYVGCHRGTTNPLGRLANNELRVWKGRAHAVFDPYWKRQIEVEVANAGRAPKGVKSRHRSIAYQRLSQDLGIDPEDCHIGMFDVAMCKRVIEVVTGWHAHRSKAI